MKVERGSSSDVPAWYAPGTLLAISVMTGLAALFGISVGPVVDWSSGVELAIYAGLAFLALNTVISVRFRQVKLILRRAQRAAAAGDDELAAKRVRGAAAVTYNYCIAASIYGLVFSTATGRVLLGLSLCAVAFVMFAVLHPYVRREIGDLRREGAV